MMRWKTEVPPSVAKVSILGLMFSSAFVLVGIGLAIGGFVDTALWEQTILGPVLGFLGAGGCFYFTATIFSFIEQREEFEQAMRELAEEVKSGQIYFDN